MSLAYSIVQALDMKRPAEQSILDHTAKALDSIFGPMEQKVIALNSDLAACNKAVDARNALLNDKQTYLQTKRGSVEWFDASTDHPTDIEDAFRGKEAGWYAVKKEQRWVAHGPYDDFDSAVTALMKE